ncbi:unnamed protein product [Leptidea sinapis]|uniref:Uncharacterized protein n=1 Tax=Leptidea sinapis TaxID=189913 RepID=A0A5E4R3X9_9NEOP|nr:unnamed protein product [Leptidea sinapis]
MSDTAMEIFHAYVNKEEVPVAPSKGPSSSSATTGETTCMSSTIVHTTEIPVAVNESKKSELNVDTLAQSRSLFRDRRTESSTF